jgi:hypothetical protein
MRVFQEEPNWNAGESAAGKTLRSFDPRRSFSHPT